MKAVIIDHFGDVDVLRYTDVATPQPGLGEVRIRIHAAGVNPVDVKIRKGLVQQRIPHVLPVIPGWDAAGVIDQVGLHVQRLKVGDEVYTYCRKPIVQWGAYAEYIVLPETLVALKAKNMTWEEAASVPLSALTAWQSLFDIASMTSGQRVLIHAGAGGVGGFAIQLAKIAGCHVITTASAVNHAYVRSLGADDVIDYNQVDFRDAVRSIAPQGVDIAFDTVGGDVQVKSADVVRKDGVLVSILAYQDEAALQQKGIKTKYHFVAPNREQLEKLATLMDAGHLKTHLAAVLPLEEAATAHRMIQTGHTVGKIALQVV